MTNLKSSRKTPVEELRAAISEKQLALFVGSGISVGSKLPIWDKLVTAIYTLLDYLRQNVDILKSAVLIKST